MFKNVDVLICEVPASLRKKLYRLPLYYRYLAVLTPWRK